jgi:hypothetical protein
MTAAYSVEKLGAPPYNTTFADLIDLFAVDVRGGVKASRASSAP